jgi:hypothetical protein
MLGDDRNLMQADRNSFPVFILGWTIMTDGARVIKLLQKYFCGKDVP